MPEPDTPTPVDRELIEQRYRRYLDRCNAHRFDDLAAFVADDVEVNGVPTGRRQYGRGLAEVTDAFPDFHWELRHLIVEGDWMSAHLEDTGTARDGRAIVLQEFALYRLAAGRIAAGRIAAGRIAAVWGDLDRWRLEAAPPSAR